MTIQTTILTGSTMAEVNAALDLWNARNSDVLIVRMTAEHGADGKKFTIQWRKEE